MGLKSALQRTIAGDGISAMTDPAEFSRFVGVPAGQLGRFRCDPADQAEPAELGADRYCHECGCTFFKPCRDPYHGACWWVGANLCSACRDGWGKADA